MKQVILGTVFLLILAIIGIATWKMLSFGPLAPSQEPPDLILDETSSVPADESAGTVRIAAVSAKTGAASEINRYMFVALRAAVKELNQKGGILGKQVTLLEFDNRSTPLGSKQAARDAVNAKVVAVIGALRSSHSLAMAPVLQEAKIPMISPESTNPKVTLVGDYIFRACFTDTYQATVLASFARKDLGAMTAVTITNANRIYSIELSKLFKINFERLGGKVLHNNDYLDSAIDYRQILADTKELSPDVIMIPSEPRDSGFIMKQAREIGITAKFLGPDSWNFQVFSFAGKAAEGSYFSTHWHEAQESPRSLAFVKDYKTSGKEIPRPAIPMAYDSLGLLAAAMESAGTTEGPAVREALAKLDKYEGITGLITFNENGDPIGKTAVILKLTDGKAVYHGLVTPE